MALKEHLKSTRVKTVPIVLCAPYVQKQQKVKAESCFITKNGLRIKTTYESNRADKYCFKRTVKGYERENWSGCPVRSLCTKAAEGKRRKLFYNEKWEYQKEYIREKLSNEETGEIYGKRKIDVEP